MVYEDTWERGKPIVFLFGSRPFAGGMCAGLETALSSMHAGRLPCPALLPLPPPLFSLSFCVSRTWERKIVPFLCSH